MTGRAFLLGDNVDTDQLAPGAYMKGGVEVLAAHCLAELRPDFAARVRPGDVVVAGRNFGAGSSREQAAEVLRHLGLACVVARSFAGIFYRNAINLGLPVVVCAEVESIKEGDTIEVDAGTGVIRNLTDDTVLACDKLPSHMLALIQAGGLIPHLKRKLGSERRS